MGISWVNILLLACAVQMCCAVSMEKLKRPSDDDENSFLVFESRPHQNRREVRPKDGVDDHMLRKRSAAEAPAAAPAQPASSVPKTTAPVKSNTNAAPATPVKSNTNAAPAAPASKPNTAAQPSNNENKPVPPPRPSRIPVMPATLPKKPVAPAATKTPVKPDAAAPAANSKVVGHRKRRADTPVEAAVVDDEKTTNMTKRPAPLPGTAHQSAPHEDMKKDEEKIVGHRKRGADTPTMKEEEPVMKSNSTKNATMATETAMKPEEKIIGHRKRAADVPAAKHEAAESAEPEPMAKSSNSTVKSIVKPAAGSSTTAKPAEGGSSEKPNKDKDDDDKDEHEDADHDEDDEHKKAELKEKKKSGDKDD